MLDKFSEMVRGNLSKMERLKLVALVTIEVQKLQGNTIMYSLLHVYTYNIHACTYVADDLHCFFILTPYLTPCYTT